MSLLRSSLQLTARSLGMVNQTRAFTNSYNFKKWVFDSSGFNQYGLYHDDVLYEDDDVKEALRRIPQHLQDERAFRIQRAVQCSVMKTVLPKDQWPTYEEDREKGRYLTSYLAEVRAERAEVEAWEKNA
eukprot:TRINITY_DN18834_c0_g1_i1.p1 TRINITY_DN18834_c0_g1~~TRINITY_DN18834_c0_g1_i1.p1  ORF type:complete len:129 (+),score=40.80 TRINITY_DN18834_c0_g1_i1:29-415(+)